MKSLADIAEEVTAATELSDAGEAEAAENIFKLVGDSLVEVDDAL